MKQTIIIQLLFLVLVSCKKDDSLDISETAKSFVPAIWKTENILVDYDSIKSTFRLTKRNLVFEDKVILNGICEDGNRCILGIDLISGTKLWSWNDYFSIQTQHSIENEFAQIEDNLIFNVGNSFYNIDLKTGNTINKTTFENFYFSDLGNDRDQLYMIGRVADTVNNGVSYAIWKSNFELLNNQPFLYPDFQSFEGEKNGIDFTLGYTNFTHLFLDTLEILAIQGVEKKEGTADRGFGFIEAYDLTNKKWLYRRKFGGRLARNTATGPIEVVNDKIYLMIGAQIICHDLWTGEEIWARDFGYHLQSAGFTISGDRLVTNNEFGEMHCLDIHTGRDIWKIQHDKSGPIRIVNGILYYSGWSTNQIHARRLSDGSEVWRLDPGRYDGAEDFKPDIYAVEGKNGEKGKIIVQTYGHAYCLEAYQ